MTFLPDPRFFLTHEPLTIGDALRIADAVANNDVDVTTKICRVAGIEDKDLSGAAIYADDVSKISRLGRKPFGICLVNCDNLGKFIDGPVAVTHAPRYSFAVIASALHTPRIISEFPRANIASGARIHPTAIIGDNAEIGPGAFIGPNAVIGPGVILGAGAIVCENSTIWCAIVGAGSRIGPSSAIGGPGFGFVEGKSGLLRVPQLGRVILGDNVEIGANVCIDRGTLGDTIIGEGSKIDNLVQIAHNVHIGSDCVIAAQVGIAGSAKIGSRVLFGGQAGIADHVSIGDDARIAAKAGVMRDVPMGETWGGYPARPMLTWMRETAALARAAGKRRKATSDDD